MRVVSLKLPVIGSATNVGSGDLPTTISERPAPTGSSGSVEVEAVAALRPDLIVTLSLGATDELLTQVAEFAPLG